MSLQSDAAATGQAALKAIGTAIDAIFAGTEAEVPALTADVLGAVLHIIPSIFPATIDTVITGILALGAPALTSIGQKLDAAALAALAVAQVKVDGAVAALEAKL